MTGKKLYLVCLLLKLTYQHDWKMSTENCFFLFDPCRLRLTITIAALSEEDPVLWDNPLIIMGIEGVKGSGRFSLDRVWHCI